MDPVTAWEHPGFASSDAGGIAVAAVKGDATLADLLLWDAATGDTIVRAYGPAGAVKFQTSAGGAGGIAWSDVSKVGSSLLDLATRDASALNFGVLLSARLVGAYTGITSVGTLTSLTVSGPLTSAGLAVTGGTQAAGTVVKTSGSGLVITAVAGTVYDLALVNASIANYLLVNPTGTPNVRLALDGITLFGGANTTAGASAGEVVLATDKALRGVFSGSTYSLIRLDGTNVSAAVGHTSLNLILRFVDPISTTVINAKVSTGAADSAGAGFRYLRIPN